MLNNRTKFKIIFGMTAAALALSVSMPATGKLSLVSMAAATENGGGGDGGGGGGADSYDSDYFSQAARDRRIRDFHRRNALRRQAINARRANARARAGARRAARNAAGRAARAARANARAARRAARFGPGPVRPSGDSASSYNPTTGITTKSVGMTDGSHVVTLTNRAGIPIRTFVVKPR